MYVPAAQLIATLSGDAGCSRSTCSAGGIREAPGKYAVQGAAVARQVIDNRELRSG